MNKLSDPRVVEGHEKSYRKGIDHHYPNENIVRLIKWFWGKPGKVLDHGFGPGENLLHLWRCGYDVSGIEVSEVARQITEAKQSGLDLKIIDPNDSRLPYEDESFDYILSNQTVYFLVTEERIRHLLDEFHRILKPGGKIIVTMMSRFSTYCTNGTPLGHNQYQYLDDGNMNFVYIAKSEDHIRDLFKRFKIHEVGHFDNYYCGVSGHHYVVLAERKEE